MERKVARTARLLADILRTMRAAGLHPSRAVVFEALYNVGDEGWRLTPLANYVGQDKSGLRRWLDELRRQGFAERVGPTYRLTQEGRSEFRARVNRFLTECPPQTRAALARAVANHK